MPEIRDEKLDLREIELFDQWTLLTRTGAAPDLDAFLRESGLPQDRQSALRRLLVTTGTLRSWGRDMKSRVAASLSEEPAEPTVVKSAESK